MDSANTLRMADLTSAGWLQKLRMRRWLRRKSVFVRSCRLLMESTSSVVLVRILYASTCSNYAQAERGSEECLARQISQHAFGDELLLETQWKRGRLVTPQTLSSEDENVQTAISTMMSGAHEELLAYERIENYQSRTPAPKAG